MSKVDDLRNKYKSVSNSSFSKFVEADSTPTKKYLDFMLKTWEDRKAGGPYRTTGSIIDVVNKFHDLTPYIENKDIYSKEYYGNFGKLIDTVEIAQLAKEEKLFNKEEHINVLLETDEFLLLQPKTHKGSMKYGANTKWCTTAKNNESIFRNYTRDVKLKENKRSKDFVNTFVNTLNKLDFSKFEVHMNALDAESDLSYIKGAQSKVESFLESLNKSKYGVRETKN